MQHLADGSIVLSATDLTNYLACAHLTQQRLALARRERPKPRPVDDPHADLVRRRGEGHEREQLELLSASCGGHVDLGSLDRSSTRSALEAGAAATLGAMRAGEPLIFQAPLFDGRWQGRADFLRRVEVASELGPYAYEVIDTKLARQVKPHVVHQISLYNRMVSELQGVDVGVAHLVLGTGESVAIELGRYAALHRRMAAQLERVGAAPAASTYPEPIAHCAICELAAECHDRRIADDHLSIVAGARRDQRERLSAAGIATVAALAAGPVDVGVEGLAPDRVALLHHQAALQVRSRESGLPSRRHLPPSRAAGYALLPDPSAGDLFFDLEGDPYVGDGGIEYLWGWSTTDGPYTHVWAHDQDEEKAAFEHFVDTVVERRRRYPDLRVFHYAAHERSKLGSLSVQYATRELEIDELLRAGVFVDLYAIVRHALQVGEESYSLKKLERHHEFARLETRVREGGGSIVTYEQWLESDDPELLEAIRAYNEEDCRSTQSLRDWLLDEMRTEAEAELGVVFADWCDPEEAEEHGPPKWMPDVLALVARLSDGLPAHAEEDTQTQAERRLVSHLLLYHHRENKPAYWRYFDLRAKPLAELLDDRDALAGLVLDETVEPTSFKRSLDYTFRFPAQEFRLDRGAAEDPTTGKGYKVVAVADDHVVLRAGTTADPPAPAALIGGMPIDIAVLRDALVDLGESLLAGDGRFDAVRALLRRESPRLTSGALGATTELLVSATLGLDRSILPIQGPPGTGKTFQGSRMIVAALRDGRRVGITAPTHAAIQNLLGQVADSAAELSFEFRGVYKPPDESDYESPDGCIEIARSNADVHDDHQLVAGTAWLLARTEHREAFDLLFFDEAGQFALASAAAAGLAAQSLVFLGDPQQLPQVTQATHPGGSAASVLEHLLDGASTMPPERGVLLPESWRMHPDVCDFVSRHSYEGRLHSRDVCGLRQVEAAVGDLTGTGLRVIEVHHEGRSQASIEEADAIAAACVDLLTDSTVTDDRGATRRLAPSDILVVAPYNLAVRTIRERVPDGVRVGTVDRFQGQQAPVVFYAMTCSAGEDVPRGLDFLFDANRLNVAVSRAECLAVLVCSPRLLDADCATLRAMELVDGVCRFVEVAERVA